MTTQNFVTLPREVVERAIESLGSFVSDHGWAQSDMDTMDTLIAATEQVQPAQGEVVDSYDEIYDAFNAVTSAAAILPTYESIKKGGIDAVTYNMVVAIEKARELLKSNAARNRSRPRNNERPTMTTYITREQPRLIEDPIEQWEHGWNAALTAIQAYRDSLADGVVLPPLPESDWLLHMPAQPHDSEWTSSQTGYEACQMENYAYQAVADALAKQDTRAPMFKFRECEDSQAAAPYPKEAV